MTKTNKTNSEAGTAKADEAAKTAVEMPQKRPVAILDVMTGSVRMQFVFLMENPSTMPVPVRNFINAFRSGSEHLLWSPTPNAPVQLVPARCVGWEVRTATAAPNQRTAESGAVSAPNEAEPAKEKPAA